MPKEPDFDLAAAHRFFAADCFNKAWDLIEKPDRSEADDRMMVALNEASLFHWMNRPDCTDRNLSVGYWQASRIFSLLGLAVEAKRAAETCFSFSRHLAPFYLGYAYEALAMAALAAADTDNAAGHLDRAEAQAAKVAEDDDRKLLEADLAKLRLILKGERSSRRPAR